MVKFDKKTENSAKRIIGIALIAAGIGAGISGLTAAGVVLFGIALFIFKGK